MESVDETTARRTQALRRYEQLTSWPLPGLGIAFLALYAWPILDSGLQPGWKAALGAASLATWGVFVLDYVVRLGLTADRLRFVRRNWFDLLVIVVPMVRPLRAVRGLVAMRAVARGSSRIGRRDAVVGMASALAAGGLVALADASPGWRIDQTRIPGSWSLYAAPSP